MRKHTKVWQAGSTLLLQHSYGIILATVIYKDNFCRGERLAGFGQLLAYKRQIIAFVKNSDNNAQNRGLVTPEGGLGGQAGSINRCWLRPRGGPEQQANQQ
ncbi:hypothetical protein AA0481_0150 [Acetobacter orientalis NRIC 0481]|nr:hypothetical protein AA0481_0150 [Acetobacter orientalis NRIC 0481]